MHTLTQLTNGAKKMNFSNIIIFNVGRYVGWGRVLNCFMLSSLPCFYAFADLLSLHLVTFLMFFILVHVTFL